MQALPPITEHTLGEEAPIDLVLVEPQPWHLTVANDPDLPHARGTYEQVLWANVVTFVDCMTLASPLRWTQGMTHQERFEELRRHFAEQIQEATETLRREVASGVRDPVGNWRKRIQGYMRRHYYDAYWMGRSQSDPYWRGFTDEELKTVRGIIKSEHEYLRGFSAQLRAKIKAGEELPGGLEHRASLYGNSLSKSYLTGITDGAHPEDSVTISAGKVATDHCAVCPPRWGTWTMTEYFAFDPGPPPPNWCEGLSNCKCNVTINHAVDPAVREALGLLNLQELADFEPPPLQSFWNRTLKPTKEEITTWLTK